MGGFNHGIIGVSSGAVNVAATKADNFILINLNM